MAALSILLLLADQQQMLSVQIGTSNRGPRSQDDADAVGTIDYTMAAGNNALFMDRANCFGRGAQGGKCDGPAAPDAWDGRLLHDGDLVREWSVYFEKTHDADVSHGIDTAGLCFYAGHGWINSFHAVGAGTAYLENMLVGDQRLRYLLLCSCNILAHGPKNEKDFVTPFAACGDPKAPRPCRNDRSVTPKEANAFIRWQKALGRNVRLVCGGSSMICNGGVDVVSDFWKEYYNRSLGVADSFLSAFTEATEVPLCLAPGPIDPRESALFDSKFMDMDKGGESERWLHVAYPVVSTSGDGQRNYRRALENFGSEDWCAPIFRAVRGYSKRDVNLPPLIGGNWTGGFWAGVPDASASDTEELPVRGRLRVQSGDEGLLDLLPRVSGVATPIVAEGVRWVGSTEIDDVVARTAYWASLLSEEFLPDGKAIVKFRSTLANLEDRGWTREVETPTEKFLVTESSNGALWVSEDTGEVYFGASLPLELADVAIWTEDVADRNEQFEQEKIKEVRIVNAVGSEWHVSPETTVNLFIDSVLRSAPGAVPARRLWRREIVGRQFIDICNVPGVDARACQMASELNIYAIPLFGDRGAVQVELSAKEEISGLVERTVGVGGVMAYGRVLGLKEAEAAARVQLGEIESFYELDRENWEWGYRLGGAPGLEGGVLALAYRLRFVPKGEESFERLGPMIFEVSGQAGVTSAIDCMGR